MTVMTDDELTSLRLENAELRARNIAASRVLELIARSPSDLQPVFDAIGESARELTGALYSTVMPGKRACEGRRALRMGSRSVGANRSNLSEACGARPSLRGGNNRWRGPKRR